MNPAVLMTDPRHFAIRGGANPHTRTADNQLKSVNAEIAWTQWNRYVDTLLDHGVDVYVANATPETTGMVFAANAGFLSGRMDATPSSRKKFYPSHFAVEHRVAERSLFSNFMRKFGFQVAEYTESLDFEGEADAFPVMTSENCEWVFTYGYRTSPEIGSWLQHEQQLAPMYTLRLTDPRYYHGDTLICNLGNAVLAWPGGLDESDFARFSEHFGDHIVLLDDDDAAAFVGNSFYVEVGSERLLFTPHGIAEPTRQRIAERGVHVVAVDISEFFGKGGGGPKCMVFNLGEIDPKESGITDEQREFRISRHVHTLRSQNLL